MNYWWAVNVAEIARIQAYVQQALHSSHAELTAGAIRTYASQAVFSDRLPKVKVPQIDRQFWHDPDSLRVLAMAVVDRHMPTRDKDIATLLALIDDWAPQDETPPVDGAPVPTRGLAALADMLAALAGHYPESPASEIVELLRRDLDHVNSLYLQTRNAADAMSEYQRWRTRQLAKITRLRDVLETEHHTSPPRTASR